MVDDLVFLHNPSWQGIPLKGRILDLLVVLADAGRPISTSQLAQMLWGADVETKRIQVVVSRARSIIGSEQLKFNADTYYLNVSPSRIDICRLANFAKQISDLVASDDWERVSRLVRCNELNQLIDEALSFRGAKTEPLISVQDKIQKYCQIINRAKGLALAAQGENAEAYELLLAANESDPADEQILAALLVTEAKVRSAAAALQRYQRYQLRLRAKGAVPGMKLRKAHESVLASENPIHYGFSPIPVDFVGRNRDIELVLSALSIQRLITILGPGGVGKTTLVNAVAAQAPHNAIWVISLSSVSAKEDLWDILASQLGSYFSSFSGTIGSEDSSYRSVNKILSRLGTLLILDNCEHLASQITTFVAQLLLNIKDLKIIATSRSPLNLSAEWIYRLEPLNLEAGAALFRSKSTAIRPGVLLKNDEVKKIIKRLDGMPLAIELAAAKVSMLPLAQIIDRVADGKENLASQHGDRVARHKTLDSVVEWSWRLLTIDDQEALEKLSLLPAGFSLELAEHILGPRAFDRVQSLVNHSLIKVNEYTQIRYQILVTIREFAISRLDDSGKRNEYQNIIRNWALTCAQEIIVDEDPKNWINLVNTESSNLEYQLTLAILNKEYGDAKVIGAALLLFWLATMNYTKTQKWAKQLVELADTIPVEEFNDKELEIDRIILSAVGFWGTSLLVVHLGQSTYRRLNELRASSNSFVQTLQYVVLNQEWITELTKSDDQLTKIISAMFLINKLENSGQILVALSLANRVIESIDSSYSKHWMYFNLRIAKVFLLQELGRRLESYYQISVITKMFEENNLVTDPYWLSRVEIIKLCSAVGVVSSGEIEKQLKSIQPKYVQSSDIILRAELAYTNGELRQCAELCRSYLYQAENMYNQTRQFIAYAYSCCLVIDAQLGKQDCAELGAVELYHLAVYELKDLLGSAKKTKFNNDFPVFVSLAGSVALDGLAHNWIEFDQGRKLLGLAMVLERNQSFLLLSQEYFIDLVKKIIGNDFIDDLKLLTNEPRNQLMENLVNAVQGL